MQGVLSWVGQVAPGREPAAFEARLYDVLFRTPSVADVGEEWLEDLNPDSLTTVQGALATPALAQAPIGARCVPRLIWPPPLKALLLCAVTHLQHSAAFLTVVMVHDHAAGRARMHRLLGKPFFPEASTSYHQGDLPGAEVMNFAQAGSSWSGWATSASTRTRRQGGWSLTARAR